MTKINEWAIPKNIQKPVETVYEIKNECDVPSFEEFMKTYESDGSFNYDDLESGGVSEVGGYGPCINKNSNCSCNCPRSDCNCISDSYGKEKWVKLFMACPSVKKVNNQTISCPNKTQTNWVHATDSYYTWISNKARIRCEKSYCWATDHMKDWGFNCGNHGFHNGDFIKGSFDSFDEAINAVLNNMDNSEEVDDVLFHLLRHMKRNRW